MMERGETLPLESVCIGADQIDVKALVKQIRQKVYGKDGEDQRFLTEAQEDLWQEQRENWVVSEEPERVPPPTLEECEVVPGEYAIDWRNPILGPVNAQLRKIINAELRAYVRPVLEKQTHLNYRIKDLFREVHQLRLDLQKLSRELDQHTVEENARQRRNDVELASARDGLLFGLAEVHELPEMDYFVFEEEHRGSEEEILERQRTYLRYFQGCHNVVDLGCGRGEFLDLLGSEGIGAVGVDVDERMIERCQAKGLQVYQNDALGYLESRPDRTVDGIFASQLVEHLRPGELVKMVQVAYAKLRDGGRLILETVSPLSLSVFANVFFVDPSHVKPVHPNTLKFVLSSAGFKDLEVTFLAPVPEKDKLSQVTIPEGVTDGLGQMAETLNENVQKLNNLLFGNQDYAVFGRK